MCTGATKIPQKPDRTCAKTIDMANQMVDSGIVENSSAVAETTPLLKQAPDRQFSVTSEKTKKKLTLATFAIIYLTMSASYSVIAPFYPTEVS